MSLNDARILALIRILVGALFLVRITPLAGLVVPHAGFLDWPEPGWKAGSWGIVLPSTLVIAMCVARMVLAACFTIGFHARASGVVAAIVGWVLLLAGSMTYTNTLHLVHLSVFVVALADSNVVLAVRPRVPASPNTSMWLVRALPLSVYLFSGLAKLNTQWLSGKTLHVLVDRGMLAIPDVIVEHARTVSFLLALIEIALPFALAWRKTRPFALWAAAALHAYLQFAVHPDVFGMVMLVLLLSFVDQKHSPSHAASAGYTMSN